MFPIQSSEVQSATWCELEGLKRALEHLEEEEIQVGTLITDRHRQVEKWLRQNRPDITHLFDVWHIAKGTDRQGPLYYIKRY